MGCEIEVWAKAFAAARIVSLNHPVRHDRTKFAMTAGAVVSKSTTSIMPRSFGLQRVPHWKVQAQPW
jgi:hypothetical protein